MFHRILLPVFVSSVLICVRCYAQCKDKYKVFPQHSACLQRSGNAIVTGKVNQQEAIDAHNKYRKMAARTFGGSNILKMIWDDEVAMVAQKWAENCAMKHDRNYQRLIPGRFSVGQNIASSPYQMTFDELVQLFYNESVDFKYNGFNVLSKVGHFTQLTWATSYILGCGYAQCGEVYFYVCNYAPGGNSIGNIGKPFSTEGNQTNLIDCGYKTCEGGGKLDSSSCSCQCSKDLYDHILEFLAPANCKLTCSSEKKEKFFCGKWIGYREADCLRLANMPFDCPYTCHICPYADATYMEGSSSIIKITNYNDSSKTLMSYICLTIVCLMSFVIRI